jgi:hypothetical protein
VKIGPWGGAGGDERNVQATPLRLVSVTIHSGDGIDGISFTYVGSDYREYTEDTWGRTLHTKNTVREADLLFLIFSSTIFSSALTDYCSI